MRRDNVWSTIYGVIVQQSPTVIGQFFTKNFTFNEMLEGRFKEY